MKEDKKYNEYQLIIAYLLGRYHAYREDGLFKDIGFNEFIGLVCRVEYQEDSDI